MSAWADDILGKDIAVDGEIVSPRRGVLNFVGGTVEDNPSTGQTDVTVAASGDLTDLTALVTRQPLAVPSSRDIALTDIDKKLFPASAVTLTVRLNSVVALPVGSSIEVISTDGPTAFAAEGGVTLIPLPGCELLSRGTGSWTEIYKYSANVLYLGGDLELST